jgi:hypothetical protein
MSSQSQSSQSSSEHRIDSADLNAEEKENHKNQAEKAEMSDAREDRPNDNLSSFQAEKAVRKKSGSEKAAIWIIIIATAAIFVTIGAGLIQSYSSNIVSYSKKVSGSYSSNPFASVEIGGDTYSIPAKLSDFVNNGWAVSAASSDENLPAILEADSEEDVILTRNDMSISPVTVENFSDKKVLLTDATVSSLCFSDSSDNGLDLTLPYGIKVYESSIGDVISTLNKEGAPYEISYYEGAITDIYMKYDEGNATYWYSIFFVDDEVSSVSLDYIG